MDNEMNKVEETSDISNNEIIETPVETTEPIAEAVAEVVAEVAPAVEETPVVEPVAEVIAAVEEAPVVEPVAEVAATPIAHTEEASDESKQSAKNAKLEKQEEIFKELALKKENNELIEVEVKARIRGGLRVTYNDVPLFLPASHFSLKRTPTEQELTDAIGSKIMVEIHELQEYDEGRKAVIVSRKHLLTSEFWDKVTVGDVVEGKISSIATFGVFVDLGGVEGLIHISRLSQVRIPDPNKLFKKGEVISAVIIELDKEKNRIALSRKELEESPWSKIEEQFEAGTNHKGIVRRLTDFGAYIELKPGVDGLLRTPEISWTKRIKKPSDVLKPGQEILVHVISASEEKKSVALSLKKTEPNPWHNLVDKYPVGTEYEGVIFQVLPQGVIVSVDNEVDGFMPRSKMRGLLQGNKIPYHPGETMTVIIADLIPDEESLILAPKLDENAMAQQQNYERTERSERSERSDRPDRGPRGPRPDRDNKQQNQAIPPAGGISLLDMLSDSQKSNLLGSVD